MPYYNRDPKRDDNLTTTHILLSTRRDPLPDEGTLHLGSFASPVGEALKPTVEAQIHVNAIPQTSIKLVISLLYIITRNPSRLIHYPGPYIKPAPTSSYLPG